MNELVRYHADCCFPLLFTTMIGIANSPGWEVSIMPEGLTFLLIFIAFVVAYTIAKVVGYMRQSEQQWEQVDKSKLKVWDDDEDDR